MKTIRKLAIFLVPLFLFSCGDDDGDNNDTLEKLIGNWLSTRVEDSNCIDPNDNSVIPDGMCGAVPCLDLTINANGTYSVTINFDAVPEVENGTYTISGNTLTICEVPNDCDVFTFTVTNTTFTIMGDDDGCDQTIIFTKQ